MVYSLAMITLPIFAYFVSYSFYDFLRFEKPSIYSAITAVIVVHIILCAFVYKAYQEDKKITAVEKEKVAEKTD